MESEWAFRISHAMDQESFINSSTVHLDLKQFPWSVPPHNVLGGEADTDITCFPIYFTQK